MIEDIKYNAPIKLGARNYKTIVFTLSYLIVKVLVVFSTNYFRTYIKITRKAPRRASCYKNYIPQNKFESLLKVLKKKTKTSAVRSGIIKYEFNQNELKEFKSASERILFVIKEEWNEAWPRTD